MHICRNSPCRGYWGILYIVFWENIIFENITFFRDIMNIIGKEVAEALLNSSIFYGILSKIEKLKLGRFR